MKAKRGLYLAILSMLIVSTVLTTGCFDIHSAKDIIIPEKKDSTVMERGSIADVRYEFEGAIQYESIEIGAQEFVRKIDNFEIGKLGAELYVQAQDIRKRVIGIMHADYAIGLNNLGLLYQQMGNVNRAEAHQLEAKKIREEVLEPNDLMYAASLNNLAGVYLMKGDFERAVPLWVALFVAPTERRPLTFRVGATIH